MSRAKKTKIAKKRSAIGLYRQVGELINRADKAVRFGNETDEQAKERHKRKLAKEV